MRSRGSRLGAWRRLGGSPFGCCAREAAGLALRRRLAVSLGVLRPVRTETWFTNLTRNMVCGVGSAPISVGCAPSSTRPRSLQQDVSGEDDLEDAGSSTSLPRAPLGSNWLRRRAEELEPTGSAWRERVKKRPGHLSGAAGFGGERRIGAHGIGLAVGEDGAPAEIAELESLGFGSPNAGLFLEHHSRGRTWGRG